MPPTRKTTRKTPAGVTRLAPAAPEAGVAGRPAEPGATRVRDPASLHEAIARRAHELYEAAGRTDGQAVAHWLEAEAEILGRVGNA